MLQFFYDLYQYFFRKSLMTRHFSNKATVFGLKRRFMGPLTGEISRNRTTIFLAPAAPRQEKSEILSD